MCSDSLLAPQVVSDKESALRKGKKTKKMIRVAGGQVRLLPHLHLRLRALTLHPGVGRHLAAELGQ